VTTRKKTELLILGCGTSSGVPLIACKCAVCRSKNPKNQRLRASVYVRHQGKRFLVDTSTDLRQQALRYRLSRVDAVLYTHPHADHLHGIDELRSFGYVQKERIPIYGNAWTCGDLRMKFPYIFGTERDPGHSSYSVPHLDLHQFNAEHHSFEAAGVPIVPLPLMHGSHECIGYRFDRVAYVTDCSYIPELSLERMKGLSVLVLDCLRMAPHPTHLNLEQALAIVEKVKPKRTVFTHLGHDFDYTKWSRKLPKGITLAYDGMKLQA